MSGSQLLLKARCLHTWLSDLLLMLLLLLLSTACAAVSDMAHGGQVLLDARCFAGIRDRLTELGGVDHRGYNDVRLAQATRSAMRQHSLLSRCFG